MRNMKSNSIVNFIWGGSALRNLCFSKSSNSGRNKFGRITVRHRKSRYSSKKIIRLLNNSQLLNLKNDFAQIIRFERDPNRTGFIALVRVLRSGFLCYIPASSSMRIGSFVAINPRFFKDSFFKKLKINVSLCRLVIVPKGSIISNISNSVSRTIFCRSSGTKAKLQNHYPKSGLASVLLASGKTTLISLDSCAYTDEVSNKFNYLRQFYKAGQSRYLGFGPEVRGVAMNPIDHPHGGGEGKTSGGRSSVSPWGTLTKGYKTISSRKFKFWARIKRKHILLNGKL